jgi:hypothetical protein
LRRNLDEVAALLQQERQVSGATAERVQPQLEAALRAAVQEQDEAAAGSLQQLAEAIQQRQRTMQRLAGDAPQAPVWLILREMEGVRQEAQAGAGDPADLLEHIYEAARGVEGMMDVHQVIADYVGPQVRVDLHVAVTNTSKPRLSPGISAKGSPISRTACAATPPAGGKAATSASRAWRGQNRPEQVRDSGFWLEDRSPELVRGGSQ